MVKAKNCYSFIYGN